MDANVETRVKVVEGEVVMLREDSKEHRATSAAILVVLNDLRTVTNELRTTTDELRTTTDELRTTTDELRAGQDELPGSARTNCGPRCERATPNSGKK